MKKEKLYVPVTVHPNPTDTYTEAPVPRHLT